jgi:predicted ATPase/DNA-binding SARP family transcriptional activator
MGGLKVTLLGGFEVRSDSGARVRLPTKKAQALLAVLGIRPGQVHLRDKLAALLWGQSSDQHARGGLRHALMAVRRALAGLDPSLLKAEGQTLGLDPQGLDVDVVAFERAVADGTPEALEKAATLYRGDLLLGFSINEPLFEDWLIAERERLRETAVDALTRLLAFQTKTGATERAIQTAVRLLALDPLQEAVHRTLMQCYARQGRRGAALKQYQLCVTALQRELGTAPEAETKTLYQELLRRPAEGADTSALAGQRAVPARAVGAPAPDLPASDTPLFGREVELGRLREGLAAARGGHGHVACVIGEAGVGKTRLVGSLAAEALALGCRVLIGHGHENDTILPFGPWVDAFRSGHIADDEELLGALHPRWRAELTRLLPEAGHQALRPASDNALSLFESVVQLVEQLAMRQPLVIVLEDLHWADEMSLRLLTFVSRRLPAWPVLLIVTARGEELSETTVARRTVDDIGRAPHALPVALPPLSRTDTGRLVRALTRTGSDAAAVSRVEARIWAMSEGNPFVAVEGMRALDQDSLWEGGREAPGATALPASVRDLVCRRLDRLGAPGQQLAAVAAVIGRRFDFALLSAASGVPESQAAAAVEEMVRRAVLQATGDHLDFTHDRVREVAYGRLLPARRRLLHRAVAEALEAAGAEARHRLDEHVEQLAHHALRGELWDRAVRYLRQAGAKAAVRSALLDARAWYEQALAALERLPESRASLEQGFEIRLELRPVLTQLGEIGLTLARLREAEQLAGQLDDDARRGRVYALLTNIRAMRGELDEALEAGTRALTLARRLGDAKLRILATTYLEVTHYYRGEYERVVELATDNLEALPTDQVHEYLGMPAPPSVYDRGNLVISLAELGRFAEAAPHEAEAIRLAELTQHAYTIGFAHRTAAMLHLLRSDWIQARSRLERAIDTLRSGNVPLPLPIVVASSAWVLAELGETSEARRRLHEGEQLLDDQAAQGLVGHGGWAYHALGRACLRLGALDQARTLAERAVAACPRHPGSAAHALHLLGDVAIRGDRFDPETVEASYGRALELAGPRGMRPLVAHCHLGLGRLSARLGKSQAAREHFTTATTMYREMGLAVWLEQTEGEASCSEGGASEP